MFNIINSLIKLDNTLQSCRVFVYLSPIFYIYPIFFLNPSILKAGSIPVRRYYLRICIMVRMRVIDPLILQKIRFGLLVLMVLIICMRYQTVQRGLRIVRSASKFVLHQSQ
jgi:hypothetical protein